VVRASRRGYTAAACRRGYTAAQLAQAATEFPEADLFDHLLTLGRERRSRLVGADRWMPVRRKSASTPRTPGDRTRHRVSLGAGDKLPHVCDVDVDVTINYVVVCSRR